jgi:glucose uptake protein GlcU
MKENKKSVLTKYIIGSALIWAATILGCAFILKETFTQISLFINGAAAIHLIVIGSLLTQCKNKKEEYKAEQNKMIY